MRIVRVVALTNFEFPADRMVRDRIRRSRVKPYQGDRGTIMQARVGDRLEAPDDLIESWLDRRLVCPEEDLAGLGIPDEVTS